MNESGVFTRWQMKYKIDEEWSKLPVTVVGLLIELKIDGDDESED